MVGVCGTHTTYTQPHTPHTHTYGVCRCVCCGCVCVCVHAHTPHIQCTVCTHIMLKCNTAILTTQHTHTTRTPHTQHTTCHRHHSHIHNMCTHHTQHTNTCIHVIQLRTHVCVVCVLQCEHMFVWHMLCLSCCVCDMCAQHTNSVCALHNTQYAHTTTHTLCAPTHYTPLTHTTTHTKHHTHVHALHATTHTHYTHYTHHTHTTHTTHAHT